jgi:hypothetical protein
MKDRPTEDKTFKETVASIQGGEPGSIVFISKGDAQTMVERAKSMLNVRGRTGFRLEIAKADAPPPEARDAVAMLNRFLPKNYSIDPKTPFLILATIAPSQSRVVKCRCVDHGCGVGD